MKLNKKIIFFVIIIFILISVFGCSIKDNPSETVKIFEEAINKGEINTALDCFDPDVIRPFRALVNIASGLFGLDGSDLLDVMPFFMMLLEDTHESYNAPQVKITITDTVIDGETAIVHTEILYSFGDKKLEDSGYFEMIKKDNKWYIRNFINGKRLFNVDNKSINEQISKYEYYDIG